jgi:hypothetical protein
MVELSVAASTPETLLPALVELLGGHAQAVSLLQDTLALADAGESYVPLTAPRIPDGATTEVSAFADEEDLSREQLQMIKARTMYQMVEEINDGATKVLFLTNPQAEYIASSPASVQKMLDALEIPKPSLVIELQRSIGFRSWSHLWSEETFAARQYAKAGAQTDAMHEIYSV